VDPLGQVSVEVVKHEQKALGLSREVLSSPSGAFHRASADTSGLKRLLAHNHLFAWTLLLRSGEKQPAARLGNAQAPVKEEDCR
jgi:hypothetical protein